MGKVWWLRLQAIATTGMIAMIMVVGLPAVAQEAEAEAEAEETSILVESTITPGIDASAATSVADISIPVEELRLLIKPLTVEELQIEAAAWLLILRNKAEEISLAEVAIRQQNAAAQSEQDAANAVTAASEQLQAAEAALAEAAPGSKEYEDAAAQVEAAKATLREAEQAVLDAAESSAELSEDTAVQELIEQAEGAGEVQAARQVLEDAKKEQQELTPDSTAYNTLGDKIATLDKALLALEAAEEKLTSAVPDSEEAKALTAEVDELRIQVQEAAEAITNPGASDSDSEETKSEAEGEDKADELGAIAEDIGSAEEQADTEETVAVSTAPEDSTEKLEDAAEQLEQSAEEQSEVKNDLVAEVTQLQLEQGAIIERFNVILEELQKKGGDITGYRTYVDALSGVELDITDTEGLGIRLIGWLTAPDGGIRIGIGLLKFGGILVAAAIIAPRIGNLVDQILGRVANLSSLFQGFIVLTIKRGILVVGALLALASLGVNLGPIIALVGGASFVLAFALQSNLGNFASGLMLLVSKPFDVGDEVKVAGYWAYVHSISLASTKLKDFSGNLITLPNNTVWGGDIINYTHADTRKMTIGINVKFSQDIDQIREIWMSITTSNPQILSEPGPGIFPWNATYDYQIWVGLGAWARTEDYWEAYVELLKGLQKRLQDAGIELAAPLQEIKVDAVSGKQVLAQIPSGIANGDA